jgi:hypothetical protein
MNIFTGKIPRHTLNNAAQEGKTDHIKGRVVAGRGG